MSDRIELTDDEKARDLTADLKACEAATPGPYWVEHHLAGPEIVTPSGSIAPLSS